MKSPEIYTTPDHIIAGHVSCEHSDRKQCLETLGETLHCDSVFFVNQVHSGITVGTCSSHPQADGDAIITYKPGELIGIFTADCVPVTLYSSDSAGLVHAGWRGFKNRIFPSFFKKAGWLHKDINAIIGPCICQACYEVGTEVASLFPEECVNKACKQPKLDLKKAAVLELQALGIEKERISVSDQCTFCSEKHYHSYRKNKTPLRNMSFVCLKSPYQYEKHF